MRQWDRISGTHTSTLARRACGPTARTRTDALLQPPAIHTSAVQENHLRKQVAKQIAARCAESARVVRFYVSVNEFREEQRVLKNAVARPTAEDWLFPRDLPE